MEGLCPGMQVSSSVKPCHTHALTLRNFLFGSNVFQCFAVYISTLLSISNSMMIKRNFTGIEWSLNHVTDKDWLAYSSIRKIKC